MAGLPGDHTKIDPSADKDQASKGYYRDARVSFMLSRDDVLLQCPYDQSHWILQPKMVLHLARCRRNYMKNTDKNKIKISVCLFDSLHHVPAEELESHHHTCPTYLARLEQERNDKEQYEVLMKTHGLDPERLEEKDWKRKCEFEKRRDEESAIGLKMVSEETWETEEPSEACATSSGASASYSGPENTPIFTGYDPRKTIKENQHKLLLNPQGLTKAERRDHRDKIAEMTLDESREKEEAEEGFTPRKRDIRVPVGYPGWTVSDGERRATPGAHRFDEL